MRKVAIVTDGSCDLPKRLIEKYNIFVVPFQVIVGSKVYKMYGDYGTISKDEFYDLVEKGEELPTTSLPAPKAFYDTYISALENAESVIGIILSQNLSSTFHNAQIMLHMLEGKDVTLVDSKVAASTLGLIVIEAAKLAQANASKEQILAHINTLIPQARLVGIMHDVEASYRSGRLSWGKKFLADALQIRPIVVFKEGKIVSGGTILGGREEIIRRMNNLAPFVVKHAITDTIVIWHVRCPDDAQQLKEKMEKVNTKGKELIVQEAGPVIGTHVGFNAIAFMYIGRYNKRWVKRKRRRKKAR
ncbi:MAG: DegV family protein [Candidatus Heimdallarchaeota archaeon]